MKFLIDNALSPLLADGLRDAGRDVLHLRDIGLAAAPDPQVLGLAAEMERILVSADTDFGTLLTLKQASKPAVVIFRGALGRRPEKQVRALLENWDVIRELEVAPALLVIEENRIRVRPLPILS